MALAEQLKLLGLIPLSKPTTLEQPVSGGMQDGLRVMLQEDNQGRIRQLLTDPSNGTIVDVSDPMDGSQFNKATHGGWAINFLRRIVWVPSEAPNPSIAGN